MAMLTFGLQSDFNYSKYKFPDIIVSLILTLSQYHTLIYIKIILKGGRLLNKDAGSLYKYV